MTTFHDLRVPYLFPKAGPVRMWVNALLLRGSDGAIFTTAEDQRAASRLPWMAADRPVACVPIGSNIDRAPPPGYDRAAFRATLGLSQEALLLAYFGLTNPSKGLGDLLVACARLRGEGLPIRLALIGGGTGATDPTNRAEAARLEQLIAELALAPILLQPGFLPPAEVSAYLLAADLAVQPYRDGVSLRRGSLMAVLAHGLPLVTTAPDPAASPLRPDVEAVLVPPGDVEALAAAIRALATDPARRARLGFAAAQRAREFQWDRIATAVLEHYAAALAGRAQRQGP